MGGGGICQGGTSARGGKRLVSTSGAFDRISRGSRCKLHRVEARRQNHSSGMHRKSSAAFMTISKSPHPWCSPVTASPLPDCTTMIIAASTCRAKSSPYRARATGKRSALALQRHRQHPLRNQSGQSSERTSAGAVAVIVMAEPNRKHPSNLERVNRIGGSLSRTIPLPSQSHRQ